MRNETANEIRIYVACLAAYNSGHLHGAWIDATLDVEEIQAQIAAMLKSSPIAGAEEYAIHDHEGFDGYALDEYQGHEAAHEIAFFIVEHPAFGGALLDHFNGDVDAARSAAAEDYCGCHDSLADYVQELTEETTQIPESLRYYIDYDAMARDMGLAGDIFTLDAGGGRVHVFWNR